MKIITINIPNTYLKAISFLLENRIYPSRSELIRVALRDFLKEELKFVEHLGNEKKLAKIKVPRPLTVLKKYRKKKYPVEIIDFERNGEKISYRIVGEA